MVPYLDDHYRAPHPPQRNPPTTPADSQLRFQNRWVWVNWRSGPIANISDHLSARFTIAHPIASRCPCDHCDGLPKKGKWLPSFAFAIATSLGRTKERLAGGPYKIWEVGHNILTTRRSIRSALPYPSPHLCLHFTMDTFTQIESTLFLAFEYGNLGGNRALSSSTIPPEGLSLGPLSDTPVDEDRPNSSSLVGLCVIS